MDPLLGNRELRLGMGRAAGPRNVKFCCVKIVTRDVEVYARTDSTAS